MLQFRLKPALLSFVWFAAATALLTDYLRKSWEIDKLYRTTNAICIYWVPEIPAWLFLPLALAGIVTLFGRWRCGLLIGVPAAVYTLYSIYHADGGSSIAAMAF